MTESKQITSQRRTLEQDRAKGAWKVVQAAKKKPDSEKYGQLAKKGTTDILTSGLGQTLAFWKAKGKSHHLALFEDVSAWVIERMKIKADQGLLVWVINEANSVTYRQARVEALAFLAWVKRFAEAELTKEEEINP